MSWDLFTSAEGMQARAVRLFGRARCADVLTVADGAVPRRVEEPDGE